MAEHFRSAVLSANARFSAGGQGLNFSQMAEAFRSRFTVTTLGRGVHPEIPGQLIQDPKIVRLMDRTPIVRGFTAIRNQLSNDYFDRTVASQLSKTDVFQGVTGQCLQSLRRAKELGAFTILDCITTHVDDYFEQQRRDCQLFGIHQDFNKAARDMVIEEYQTADVIRVMSDYAKQTFLDRGVPEERVFVAKPPLDARAFPIADFREPRFRVSFVGLLVPAKGFHYLIDAFRNLPIADSELVLWTNSGHRAIARYMQKQLEEDKRIHLRPVSVRDNYDEVYGKSHVLVHPSLADGYSYAVMEGMASGLPVIVTSCTGSAQLIRDGENGFVVPPRDPEAIRERLLLLAQNPGLAKQMGAAARKTIQQETPEAFNLSYTAQIESFLAGRN